MPSIPGTVNASAAADAARAVGVAPVVGEAHRQARARPSAAVKARERLVQPLALRALQLLHCMHSSQRLRSHYGSLTIQRLFFEA